MPLPSLDLHVIKRAVISATTATDTALVAAVAGKEIHVLQLNFINGGTQTVRFESGPNGAKLSGVMDFAANTGMVLPHSKSAWYVTVAGEALSMETGQAVTTMGALSYIEVDA